MLSEAQWTQVVEQAVRAPSIHNTQPWTFTVRGDALEVRRDPARALPAADPTGRQQVLSCGVGVHFATVALAAAGFAAEVDVLPDPADPDHLATVRVVGRHEPTAGDREAAEAIGRRHTDRSPFLAQPLPAGLVDQLQALVGRDGVWLAAVTRAEEEAAVAGLLERAEELEQRDPAYRAELQAWTRSDPAAPDGVPAGAVPDAERAQRASTVPIRDFGTAASVPPPVPADEDPPPAVERPAVVLLGTVGDDPASWVRAGLALGRLLLRITAEGLAASPLTQVLDQTWARERLTHRLGLVGHPQMLLRLGRPGGDAAPTGRRPVTEVLTIA